MEDNFGCRDVAECELDAIAGGVVHTGPLQVGFMNVQEIVATLIMNREFSLKYVPAIG
jgi:hypothetical protein